MPDLWRSIHQAKLTQRILRQPVLFLAWFALLLHVAASAGVVARYGSLDALAFRSLDCEEYVRIATNIHRDWAFSQDLTPPLTHDTWRTPGYPYALAAMMNLVGEHPAMLILAQQLIAALSVVLVFLIARKHTSGRRAMLCALLFALEPFRLYYSFWFLATTVFTLVLLLTWHSFAQAIRTQRWVWYALLGTLAGWLMLVRPVAILVPPILAVALLSLALLDYRRHRNFLDGARQLLSVLVFVMCAFAPVEMWRMTNAVHTGHAELSSQSGVVLAYFKATEVQLWSEGRADERYLETSLSQDKGEHPHTVWNQIDERLRRSEADFDVTDRDQLRWTNLAQGNKTSADSFVISRELAEIGTDMLLADPLDTALCCAVRAAGLIVFPLGNALSPPEGIETSRMTDAVKAAPYVFLLAGLLWRVFRRSLHWRAMVFPLLVTFALLAATVPQLDPRFRVPLIPMLLVIAMHAARPGDRTTPEPADSRSPATHDQR